MKKKTFELVIPEFHVKSLYSAKAIFFVLAMSLLGGSFYWSKQIYPYYRTTQAAVYAPSREIKAGEMGNLADGSLMEGDLFQKGAPLFSLNGMVDFSEITRLDGQISALKVQLDETKLQADQIMEQYVYLQKELGGVDSPSVMDEILAEVQGWQEKSAGVSLSIARLEAQKLLVQDQLARLSAVAPFDGVVLRSYCEAGEKIKAGDPVLLVCQKNLSIEAELPETMLSYIHLNQAATIKLPSYPGKTWNGQITWISPCVSSGKLKIRIQADDLPFKAGLSADVLIKIR